MKRSESKKSVQCTEAYMTRVNPAKLLTTVLLSLVLAFAFIGCGSNNNSDENNSTDTSGTSVDSGASANSGTSVDTQTEKADWEVSLDEYEAIVDEMVVLLDRAAANPNDTSIRAEVSALTVRLAEWQTKATDLGKTLSASESAEYGSRLLKIIDKLQVAMDTHSDLF